MHMYLSYVHNVMYMYLSYVHNVMYMYLSYVHNVMYMYLSYVHNVMYMYLSYVHNVMYVHVRTCLTYVHNVMYMYLSYVHTHVLFIQIGCSSHVSPSPASPRPGHTPLCVVLSDSAGQFILYPLPPATYHVVSDTLLLHRLVLHNLSVLLEIAECLQLVLKCTRLLIC